MGSYFVCENIAGLNGNYLGSFPSDDGLREWTNTTYIKSNEEKNGIKKSVNVEGFLEKIF